jgi:signal transduction histidine kinase
MMEAEGAVGMLSLLYDADLDDSTLPLLLARANTFADLAAVALRKARLLEQSEERRLQLEAVEESRARLLRGFSHDIRNPLANADGFLQLLALGVRGPLTPVQLETLQRARTSLSAGLRLLRDLLDFAIANVGRIPLTITKGQIKHLLHDVVEDHRASAEAKRISLEFTASSQLPHIHTDMDRVRQVLDNLLSNAVKYTQEGGAVRVRCDLRNNDYANRSGRWLCIDVGDSGVGIPPEHLDDVFQEFTRLRVGEEAGTGIGLAISQWLANALGGRITLASAVGKGSTFSFWLPVETRSDPRNNERGPTTDGASPA